MTLFYWMKETVNDHNVEIEGTINLCKIDEVAEAAKIVVEWTQCL